MRTLDLCWIPIVTSSSMPLQFMRKDACCSGRKLVPLLNLGELNIHCFGRIRVCVLKVLCGTPPSHNYLVV